MFLLAQIADALGDSTWNVILVVGLAAPGLSAGICSFYRRNHWKNYLCFAVICYLFFAGLWTAIVNTQPEPAMLCLIFIGGLFVSPLISIALIVDAFTKK